ncbi:MAG: serine/threonine protein phosphatase [Leptolyngbya sp. PLA3]|nr:MAG: serine/threonine protein phosphatase [Cyanobacteria bacterium CYA]MCE7968777.1 serine/threonine protein phosphatase [Leptolyngbya sp. PL-A3]
MKILAFSDIHRDLGAVEAFAVRARASDVLVGAGDFATRREGLQPVIDALAALGRPTVLVCGNAESPDELQSACARFEHLHVLHASSVELEGLTFFGLGGAIPPTPFGQWSVDFDETQADHWLDRCPRGCVLVTHSPAYGHCDRTSAGKCVGSRAVLACVERCRPALVFSGHVHDAWGQSSEFGPTRLYNVGPRALQVELSSPATGTPR